MAEEFKTGTGLLRAAVRARKCGIAVIAQQISVAGETLHQFAHGTGPLPPDKLQALCQYLFGGAVELNLQKDLLQTTNDAPAVTMSAYPPPIDTSKLPKHKIPTRGPQPVKPAPPQPKAKRAGWVD
jgi:hypothetical protein